MYVIDNVHVKESVLIARDAVGLRSPTGA